MRLAYLREEDCLRHYNDILGHVSDFTPRTQGCWYSQAYAQITLANLAYALGRPLAEVRASLSKSTDGFERLFSLRGQTVYTRTRYRNGEPMPPEQVVEDGYTSVESFQAGLVGLITAGVQRASQLVTLAGPSPGAELVSPRSEVCTSNQQTLSHALNALLADDLDSARLELQKLTARRAAAMEKQLAATLSAVAGETDVRGELDALLFHHGKLAGQRNNWTDASLYLCLPALGLASLAIQRGQLEASRLTDDPLYAPWELLKPISVRP